MKLTKSILKQIIKEEMQKVLQEKEEWWHAAGITDEEIGAAPSVRVGAPPMSKEDEISGNERRDMFKVLMDPKVSPDQKRRTINKAWKDGLFGDPKSKEAKEEWRRLRRKHHKRKKWAGALSKDPRANAIDQAEKLYRKGKRAEAKKLAQSWIQKNPKKGGNYGRIARQIIKAPN